MSGTSQNPATGGRDASVEQQRREAPEAMPYPEVQQGIRTLDRAADQVHERLRDIADLDAMTELRSDLPPSEQLAGLTLLQSRLINVLTKIAKANPDLKLERVKPGELMRDVTLYGVQTTPDEVMAWQKYMELISNSGPTSRYLVDAWRGREGSEGMVQQAEMASKGFMGKIGKFAKEHPGQALVYAAATAAGVYLGYKLIKGIWGWFTKKDDTGGPKESFWRRLIPGTGVAVALSTIAAAIGLSAADRKGLMRELFMKMAPDEIRELIEKGEALPEKVRKELEETRAEVERLRAQVEGAKAKVTEAADAVRGKAEETKQEIIQISREVADAQGAKFATLTALVEIYCLDDTKFSDELKNNIGLDLDKLLARPLTVGQVVQIYEDHEGDEKIDPALFGIDKSTLTADAQPEVSFFHASRLIAKAKEYYTANYPGVDVNSMSLEDFLGHLSGDPAHSIHEALIRKFDDLQLGSITDLPGQIGKLASGEDIDAIFKTNLNLYLEHLGERYKVQVPPQEKTAFWLAIGSVYEGGNLNWGPQDIEAKLDRFRLSAATKAEGVRLLTEVKAEAQKILPELIRNFDLDRPDMPSHHQVLRRNLNASNLFFKDAIQLTLLAEGVQWDTASQGGELDKGKGVAMLLMIGKMLKGDARAQYLANVTALVAGNIKGFKIPEYLGALAPYLRFMGEQTVRRVKRKAKHWWEFVSGIPQPSAQPDFRENLKNADWLQLPATFGLEAFRGGMIQIPKELILSVTENWGDFFDETTDAKTLFDALFAAGGTLIYSKSDTGEDLGVLYLFGKYFFVKPMGIALHTFQGLFSGAAVKTYLVESAPYIAVGALLNARFHQGIMQGVAGMLHGAKRGAMAPVTMPIAGYRTLRETYRIGGRIMSVIRSPFADLGSIARMQRSLTLFDKYNELTKSVLSPIQAAKALPKGPVRQARRLIFQDVYQVYRERWANYFIRDYNDLFDYNPALKHEAGDFIGLERKAHEDIKEFTAVAKRVRNFMEDLRKLPDLDAASFTQRLEQMAKEGLLTPDELKQLIKTRIADPKKFKEFKQMIDIAKRESFAARAAKAVSKGAERAAARSSEWLHDRKWYQDFEKWRGAKFTKAELADLAKRGKTEADIAKILKAKKIPPAMADTMAARIAKAGNAAEVETIIKEVAEAEKFIVKFPPEVGRLLKFLRPIARAMPYAGAAVYGFQAYQAFAEAGSTSNTERRGILLQKGGLYTAATGAEVAIAIASKVALAAGAVGATTAMAAAAAPLPHVYMGEAALESKYEATKTAQ
ncbi:MAG: hypothetical protein V1908_02545, partial [Candidatus Peregrinibacteria bacterium]